MCAHSCAHPARGRASCWGRGREKAPYPEMVQQVRLEGTSTAPPGRLRVPWGGRGRAVPVPSLCSVPQGCLGSCCQEGICALLCAPLLPAPPCSRERNREAKRGDRGAGGEPAAALGAGKAEPGQEQLQGTRAELAPEDRAGPPAALAWPAEESNAASFRGGPSPRARMCQAEQEHNLWAHSQGKRCWKPEAPPGERIQGPQGTSPPGCPRSRAVPWQHQAVALSEASGLSCLGAAAVRGWEEAGREALPCPDSISKASQSFSSSLLFFFFFPFSFLPFFLYRNSYKKLNSSGASLQKYSCRVTV